MADLRVEFAGVEFKNPVLIASSSLTNHPAKLRQLEEAGAGGVVTKLASTAVPPRVDRQPYRAVVLGNGAWCVAGGDRRLTLKEGVELVKTAKKELRIPVVANVIGKSYFVDSWVENALALQKAGADMLELDLNSQIYHQEKGGFPLFTGECIGQHPDLTSVVTNAVKNAVTIPVVPKLTPKFLDLTPIGLAARQGGADGITAINALAGFGGVDIRNGGRPIFPGMESEDRGAAQSFAALAGSPLTHVAAYHTVVLARNVGLPLCSSGGIMDWEIAVQRLMTGATVVQLCTAVYLHGPKAVTDCVEGMSRFLSEYGYQSPADIIGLGLPYVVEREELTFYPLKAVIRDSSWAGWSELVERVRGDCLALTMQNGGPVVDKDECTGCMLCYWYAPPGMVSMEVQK
jgi:dihydropyrimidine dehydrogenase (NAD+) subunit PreA